MHFSNIFVILGIFVYHVFVSALALSPVTTVSTASNNMRRAICSVKSRSYLPSATTRTIQSKLFSYRHLSTTNLSQNHSAATARLTHKDLPDETLYILDGRHY